MPELLSKPNYLGPRTIEAESISSAQKLELNDRFDNVLQKLHLLQSGEEHYQPLAENELEDIKAKVRKAGRLIKRDIIDKKYPIGTIKWKDVVGTEKDYYALLLEGMANEENIHIFKCKNMWYAKGVLGRLFVSDNNSKKRSDKEKMKKMEAQGQVPVEQVIMNSEFKNVH